MPSIYVPPVSIRVSSSHPLYIRLNSLWDHIASIPCAKRPRVWVLEVFDRRHIILDNTTVIFMDAAEIVTYYPDKLRELEGVVGLHHWDHRRGRYITTRIWWVSLYITTLFITVGLYLFAHALGVLSYRLLTQ